MPQEELPSLPGQRGVPACPGGAGCCRCVRCWSSLHLAETCLGTGSLAALYLCWPFAELPLILAFSAISGLCKVHLSSLLT